MRTSFLKSRIKPIYVCQLLETMSSPDIHVYYWAGIGVVATTYGIEVQRISIGDGNCAIGEAILEPVAKWCNLSVGLDYFKAMRSKTTRPLCWQVQLAVLSALKTSDVISRGHLEMPVLK
jgi:hypothetical protein